MSQNFVNVRFSTSRFMMADSLKFCSLGIEETLYKIISTQPFCLFKCKFYVINHAVIVFLAKQPDSV
jgi:hypothetical protein